MDWTLSKEELLSWKPITERRKKDRLKNNLDEEKTMLEESEVELEEVRQRRIENIGAGLLSGIV